MEMRKTEAIAEAALKKQEAPPDLLSNRTGSSHFFDFVVAPHDRHPHGLYAVDHGRSDPHTALGRTNVKQTNTINEKGCKQSNHCHIPLLMP